ncbi:hypothetical protein BGZ76_007560 [Entomortierella beljakovae]|nr:hypothetical protein BGZ76_007560 [Entomortierella beljakovae]
MDNSLTDVNTEASPAILPSTGIPGSWTTSQGEDMDGPIGMLEDDGDIQDSDDPDTTYNFDQELDEEQDEEDDLEAKMDELYQQLQEETKVKESAETLLEVYRSKDVGNAGDNKPRNQVEQKIRESIERIESINQQLDYYKHKAFDVPSFGYIPEQIIKDSQPSNPITTGRSHSNSFSTSDYADNEDDRQSIYSALADIVNSLRNTQDSPPARLEHLVNLANILKQNQYSHPGYPLHELVAWSLMSDHRIESERIEALKLVRCFITTRDGMRYISDGVLRAIIAIAEQNDEKLRNACLETLGEMIMSDPKPVARCGGFRAILIALSDSLQDLSDALLKVFLYMLESPDTRVYVRQGLDSEMVMSVFTDIYSQGPTYTDRVKASGRIVTSMVRSWAGLFDLCSNDKRAIRSLVQSIKLPIQENRKVLLDMFYEIFRIQTPKWLKGFLDGNSVKPTQEDFDGYWGSNIPPLGLVDNHQSVVLTVFIEAGLIETLISLIVESGAPTEIRDLEAKKVLRKATLLIPELMQLACKVLPSDKSTHLQTLPSLLKVATNFEDPALRHVATSAFQFIDTLIRASNGIIPERLDGQKQTDRIKQKMGIQLDESNFRALLNETQHFTDLLTTVTPTILSASPEGSKYLASNKILRLIADGLAQLDPVQGQDGSDPIFSKERMEKTSTAGYFEMLGTLCKTRNGSKLLEKFKIFNLYYRLSELRSRDDIAKRIITTMDYSMYVRRRINDGHPRVILSKVMTSGYKHIRLYATEHLGTVIKNDKNEFNDWAIRLLSTQLCDPSLDVCKIAIRALDNACAHKKNLDFLIQLRPNLDHLGEAGNPLLLRFLSTSKGFHYLDDMSYIDVEMDDWFTFANRQYMIQTEVKLAKAMELQRINPFSEDGKFENEAEHILARAKQVLMPHFYGELTRTDEGCDLLRRKGHFEEYARFIREHCAESKDVGIISDLKAILWAVGHIGSTVGGLPFLEDEDLIKYIVGMAERSKILSVKATCFYVLGLMCKTTQGIEILEDYGWQGILHRDRTPRGLCLPKDLDRFLDVPRWSQYKEFVPRVVIPLTSEGDIVEKEVLKATGELGNHILTNGASKNLAKIKAEYPVYFGSLSLYVAVLDVLGSYHFRLPVRRFILGLFDLKLEGGQVERLDLVVSATLPSSTPADIIAATRDHTNLITRSSFDSPSRPIIITKDTGVMGRSSFDSPSRSNMMSREPYMGRSSFDSPTRITKSNGVSPRVGRSQSSEIIPGPPLPLPSTSIPSPSSQSQSPIGEGYRRLDVQKGLRKASSRENIDIFKANGDQGRKSIHPSIQSPVEISPTFTISQPPIPPPRPPTHAYEILYTNKPYHKNFAKEAGLAPLPPRVKALHFMLDDDDNKEVKKTEL